MEYIAKFIIVVFIVVAILVILYKLLVRLTRFIIERIDAYVNKKNAHIIRAEIEKTEKLLDDLDIEQMTLEEARKSGKNFTGIL